MAFERGGYADKLGNRYEGRWVVRQLLRLLNEEIRSVGSTLCPGPLGRIRRTLFDNSEMQKPPGVANSAAGGGFAPQAWSR